jgi:hypothetical protein
VRSGVEERLDLATVATKDMLMARYGKETPIGQMKIAKLGEVIAQARVMDRIRAAYQARSHIDMELKRFKRKHGYCGGGPSCMTYTGQNVEMCSPCRKAIRNPRYKRKPTEYGKLRSKEREEAREVKTAKKMSTHKSRRAA